MNALDLKQFQCFTDGKKHTKNEEKKKERIELHKEISPANKTKCQN